MVINRLNCWKPKVDYFMNLWYNVMFINIIKESTMVISSQVNEIWKPLKRFEDKYEISNLGRVRNKKTKLFRQFQIQKKGKGYYCFNVYDEKNKKTVKIMVHRAVAEMFIPNIDNKPYINHIDGNSFNNCVNNLEWVTAKENVEHSFMQKNKTYKHQLGARKLSDEQLLKIRDILKKRDINKKYHKPSNKEIGKMFGVDAAVISDIWNGKRYLFLLKDFDK